MSADQDTKLPHGLTSFALAVLCQRAQDGDATPEDAKALADVVGVLEGYSGGQAAEIERLKTERQQAIDALGDAGRDAVRTTGCLEDGTNFDHLHTYAEISGLTEAVEELQAWADGQHIPVVARLASGEWGVHCNACSAVAEDYVPRCLVHDDLEWPSTLVLREAPPSTLIDAKAAAAEGEVPQ